MGDCYRNIYFKKYCLNDHVDKTNLSNPSHTQITTGFYLDSSNYLTGASVGQKNSLLHSGSFSKSVKSYTYNRREDTKLISEELNYSRSGLDEFCTYGTSRFVNSSTVQPIGVLSSSMNNMKKEQNLRVKFSDEYSTKSDANKTICPILETQLNNCSTAPTMAISNVDENLTDAKKSKLFDNDYNDPESPISETKYAKESSELSPQNVTTLCGKVPVNEKETNLMSAIKNLEETIKRMNEKLENLKTRVSEDRNQSSANEDVEIEEFEETTTRMVPIPEFGRRHHFEHILSEFDSLTHQVATGRNIAQYSSAGNIDTMDDSNYRNDISFEEWFSQYDQSYSVEQRSFIENLYETFQFDRTTFVKSIIGLLAKNVKSIGVQLDSIETTDKSILTNQTVFRHVHSGDHNSTNVSVVEHSTLKHFGVQSKPPMRNAFTCPIIFTTYNEKSTLTMITDYHYCSLDIDYRNSVSDASIQVVIATPMEIQPIDRQLKANYRKSFPNNMINYNNHSKRGSLINITREKSESPVADVNRYFTINYGNRLMSLKKSLGSKVEEEKPSKIVRLERYLVRNASVPNRYFPIGNRGKKISYFSRTATKSYRPYQRPSVLVNTGDNHLTQFNDFMRNTILQGYSIPVENNIGYSARIDPLGGTFGVPTNDDDNGEKLTNRQ